MKFDNLIQAVKAVREIGLVQSVIEKNLKTARYEIVFKGGDIGLRDAKLLCEDIMALGVKRFLENELRELNGTGPVLPNCNSCGKPMPMNSTQPCKSCYEVGNF